ncbi:uncharacterized protein SETTUDRAFT_19633 [Exserohilum turcica Et28A]|uniref:Uncharacterized protein n=1 Tax=Exserohilum turcicum (strain 28A) TaxID=671987 RepID=R0KGG6_EXST2|nr:uncharacterized protein SETTUDRAFT_19633 [Exserohilum turcica Et28A]EOA87117.1 hypothetical protein SETTUDRAFT_19633 [Exserohilum turcica Et28A]
MAPSTALLGTVLSTLPLAASTPLTKRKNDDEYVIPKEGIILLVILGAGLAVCMGLAIHATFGFRKTANGLQAAGAEQMEYMAEVRIGSIVKLSL